MKAEGKFSFTFNREHWVWVDHENKYVSRGMQQPRQSNNNNNNNNNNHRGSSGYGNRSSFGGGLAAITVGN
jgi:hypothetical protein